MKVLCHLIFLPDARKLRISQDICYVRTAYIEFTMTMFGQCHNVLNNNSKYMQEAFSASSYNSKGFHLITFIVQSKDVSGLRR